MPKEYLNNEIEFSTQPYSHTEGLGTQWSTLKLNK
jgi:hypothetical protein